MTTYIQVKNNEDEFVVNDTYSNMVLEEIINLGTLGTYSTEKENEGGICDIRGFVNNYASFYGANDLGFHYPFFCCLGTKRSGKFCVLYNKGNTERPCTIINSYCGICSQGTRKAHTITVTGAQTKTFSWSANYTNLRDLYWNRLYPIDFATPMPLESLPECLGTARQPIAIICDNNNGHINLSDYYVFVFGETQKQTPQKGDGALCCYNSLGEVIFSSINHPLIIDDKINGNNAPISTQKLEKNKKIGISAMIYNSSAIPVLTQKSVRLQHCKFSMNIGSYDNNGMWNLIYEDTLNNAIGICNTSKLYSYIIVDLEYICNFYGL